MEEKTIKEQLDAIVSKLDEQQTKKKFKLPLGIRMSKGKFRRQNAIIVMIVRMNGSVAFKVSNIEDNVVKIGDAIYDASADYVLRYKQFPMIILPEWNIKPFSPRENLETAVKEGSLTSTEKFILARIKMDTVKAKMQLNWKVVLIILAIGAAILYGLDYMQLI